MITRKVIVLFGVLALAACSATSQFPMDDAYYHPSQTTQTTQTTQNTQTTQTTQNTPATPATPRMEILHQQDTTITVRIKR